MALTNAEKQRAFRARQLKLNRKARTLYLTEEEAFYVERTLKSMREENGVPAMMRNAKGQLKVIDI